MGETWCFYYIINIIPEFEKYCSKIVTYTYVTNSRKRMKVIVKINYKSINKIFGIIAFFRTFLVINFVYLLEAT